MTIFLSIIKYVGIVLAIIVLAPIWILYGLVLGSKEIIHRFVLGSKAIKQKEKKLEPEE